MKWITRERPKIDRIACPWLIKKFVDVDAEFLYVPFNEVIDKAKELNAIPFDIPDVEFTHYNEECTFDYIIKKYQITDPAVLIMSKIVRGADTDRHDLAKESAGLWAISAGLAHNITNDFELLKNGMMLYDALYSWATHLYKQNHLQNSPFESLLHEVYTKFLKDKKSSKKTPAWVKDLKEIIQDQIDAQFTFDLKKISSDLELNPSYLSREFSKYFEDLNFGDYVRKLRIEKAINLIQNSTYTLTEIAYMTGFSDQSHFTRIFKLHTGKNPSSYKKSALKSNTDTKGK
ncbi:chromate resistance protein ChrB domain-containing protein [Flavobacterium hibernum]|uniref:AraC family transcriptional regulator n=1 Tax=Flavobacterium hibernum TaxID=37752 RepID=A0A0D0EEA3_9FLAO|nr:chromate resistance protein ChrB domain-containing protein [Flavobacterium hibernum]KIO52004.1 AraC family transcriptional regulator [Flavobacterium hibernum]OXA89035.1 AraC family transcriptional regulator [Flavobacterium hibernum]STO09828.1 Bacillibactin transport regulator [Flavobacterium hibernum]